MRDYSLYLKDIFLTIESIEVFTAGMDYATFVTDDKTMSAVIRKLEIIGEAVKQLPEEIRVKHPEIPWNADSRHAGQTGSFLFQSRHPPYLANDPKPFARI